LNKDYNVPIVDSKKQQLPVKDIVTTAAQNTKSPYDDDQALAIFLQEINSPSVKIIRYGNTLFVIRASTSDPRFGIFRALNADTAANYLASSVEFAVAAYKAGYDGLSTDFYDESILNIFRTISKNPPNPDMAYSASRLNDGGFRVTLQLGTPRKAGGA